MDSNRWIGFPTCILGIAALLGACGADAAGIGSITRDDVTRAYTAAVFTTTTDGTTRDQLARGASLDLTLHEDGRTTGSLVIPGADGDGGDLAADLAGTFSFDDRSDQVTLDQSGDTFLRDLTFTAVRSSGAVQLEGERAFGDTVIRVVLR